MEVQRLHEAMLVIRDDSLTRLSSKVSCIRRSKPFNQLTFLAESTNPLTDESALPSSAVERLYSSSALGTVAK